MYSGRAIDHIGVATRALDALAARYEGFGFTLTPLAWHQDHMGTSNRLVQFKGRNFVELLEVDRPATMLPHAPGFMSFGAFNHKFLKGREGLDLIVFRTQDTPGDLAAWKAKGLDVYDQFDFERQATLPDGSQATVRFELGFVTDPAMPDILFYVCHNRAEQHFWKPEFQSHANGAEEIEAIVLCSRDPARHGAFLSALFDGAVTVLEHGISVGCEDHRIDVLTPAALAHTGWTGDPGPEAQAAGFVLRAPGRAGMVTTCRDAGGAFIQWVN